MGGARGALGSLAPWTDNSFPGLKGSAVARLRNWQPLRVPEGDVFQPRLSHGCLAPSERRQFPNSASPSLPGPAELSHITLRTKAPEAPEALEAPAGSKSPLTDS